jgi:hypothetical protein
VIGECPVTISELWENHPMNASELSLKAAVSVSEMADLCEISRSRFYELMKAGVFPKPVQHPSSSRPLYDIDLIAKCLEIRATGIGLNGVPVLFNRKSKRSAPLKQKLQRPVKDPRPDPTVEPILDSLKGLGLPTTQQAVCDALAVLYPTGIGGLDLGDVVRKVFLHLQAPKK